MLHAPLNVVLARRAASPRRGSVLIMVVAVLVLLALMGTAYISVVRIDRLNAGSSAVRPPVAAIVAAADDALTKDLYGTAAGPVLYRPPGDPGTVGYEHYDSNIPVTTLPAPARSHDPWLADRVPMLINVDANGNGSIDTTASSTNVEQNMPAWWATTELSLPFEDVETGTRLTFPPAQRFAFVPTSKTVTYTSGLGTDSSPKQYPAFRIARLVDPTSVPNMTWQYVGFYDPDGGGALPLGWYPVNSNSASWAATQPRDWNDYLYIAADADADGIADSLLFRMPGPGAAGQTFYGAVRIVDNNSAININTAWSNESDYRADGGADDNGIAYAASNRYDAFGNAIVGTNAGTKLGMFPSHVGLIQILSTYTLPGGGAPPTSTEMNRLNNERFNGYASPGSVDQTENPPRTDFGHATAGDAMYTQAGRRLDNPGAIATDPGPPVSKVAYKPLSAGDGAALAARAGSMLLNLDKYNLDPNNAALLSPKFRASNTTTVGGQVFTAHRVDYLFHDSAYLLVLNHVGATTTSENNVFNVFPSSRPGYWFDWNYNYPTPGATTTVWSNPFSTTTPTYPAPGAAKPIRSLITSRNPVSTYVPKHTVTTGDVPVVGMMPYAASLIPTWDPDPTVTYTPGQLVKVDVDPPNGTWRVYRRLETAPATPPNPAPAPFAGTGSASDNAWDEEHWTGEGTSVRASANKSGFAELWRAFWNVMASTGPVPTGYLFATPFDVEYDAALTDVANTAEWEYDPYVGMKFVTGTFAPDSTTVLPAFHPNRMFRSSWRALPRPSPDPAFSPTTPRVAADHQVLLRSAIAAANVEDLRDSDEEVTVRRVTVGVQLNDMPIAGNVYVYGHEKQPYISEVYVNTDASIPTRPNGYVAIELYNPHSVPIDLVNCRIASVNRTAATAAYGTTEAATTLAIAEIGLDADGDGVIESRGLDVATSNLDGAPLPATVIPANGYLVLENFDSVSGGTRPGSTGLTAAVVPAAVTPPNTKNYAYIPGLERVLGSADGTRTAGEVVLLRPAQGRYESRTLDSAPTQTLVYFDAFEEADPVNNVTVIGDVALVPLDQFDFTGLSLAGTGQTARAWSYARGSGATQPWNCVYPGRYDAAKSREATPAPPRQQGVRAAQWVASGQANVDPWDPTAVPPTPPTAPAITLTGTDAGASFPQAFTIQLSADGMPGPYPLDGPTGPPAVNRFPFGGFARVGDLLQVPFIGAYRITPSGATTTFELNAVTMDAAMAEDTDLTNDAVASYPFSEQVGRFAPVGDPATGSVDFGAVGPANRYYWATDLFDYFTAIQSPHADAQPNVHPRKYRYYDSSVSPPWVYLPVPTPVQNSTASAVANLKEEGVGVEGLVNINTAPWAVLAQVPWTDDAVMNRNIAKSIVLNRLTPGNGPFRSLHDLARVSVGWYESGTSPPTYPFPLYQAWAVARGATFGVDEAGNQDGDFAPFSAAGTPPVDGVVGDFEEKFLALTRVSNLLTVRSDSFTVYAIAQGWRDAGSASAQLATQVRSAVIVDRTGVSPNGDGSTQTIVPIE